MGQYYKPILTVSENKKSETLVFYSHEFEEGLKLMEHSYVGNYFVTAVKIAIAYYNSWGYTTKLTWAGDYADAVKGETYNLFEKYEPNINVEWGSNGKIEQFSFKDDVFSMEMKVPRYLVNLDFLEYIDYEHIGTDNEDEYIIDPLPLLTADGNGRGGGDYSGSDIDFVGIWKGCIIQFTDTQPIWAEELKCQFKEEW